MTTVFITFFGKYLVFFLPAIAVLFFLCLQKNAKVKLFWFSIITVPTIFILSRIASRLYFHPRPFVVEGVAPLIPHAPDNGFPSDHALLSFTISAIVFTQNKKWGSALFLLSFFVSLGRVLSRVHSWVDIVGSLIIVLCVMRMTQFFYDSRTKKQN